MSSGVLYRGESGDMGSINQLIITNVSTIEELYSMRCSVYGCHHLMNIGNWSLQFRNVWVRVVADMEYANVCHLTG